MKRILIFAAAAVYSTGALAALSANQVQKASGLAEILKREQHCGYSVNAAELEKYYSANDLATPEVLAYIANSVRLGSIDPKPTPSECSITKATAKAIGVLIE